MGHSTSCCSASNTNVRPLLEVFPAIQQQVQGNEGPKQTSMIKPVLKDACNSPIISILPRKRHADDPLVKQKYDQSKFLSNLKSNSPNIVKNASPLSISEGMSFKEQLSMRKVVSTAQRGSTQSKNLESPVLAKDPVKNVTKETLPILSVGKKMDQPYRMPPLMATLSQNTILKKGQFSVLDKSDPEKSKSPPRKTSSSKNAFMVVPQKMIFDSLKEVSSQNSEKRVAMVPSLAIGDLTHSRRPRRESRSQTLDLDLRKGSQKSSKFSKSRIVPNPTSSSIAPISLNKLSATPRLARSSRVTDLLSSRKKTVQPDDGEGITTQLVKGRDLFASSPGAALHREFSPSLTTREVGGNVSVGSIFREQFLKSSALVTPQFCRRPVQDLNTNQDAVNQSNMSAADSARVSSVIHKNYSKIQSSRRRLLSGTLVETKRKDSAFGVISHQDSESRRSQLSPPTKGVNLQKDKLIVPESADEAEHST